LINKLKNWTPDYGRILFSFSKLTSLKATRALQVFDYKLAA